MATSSTPSKEQISGNNLLIIMVLITFLVVGVSVLVSKALISSIVLNGKVLKAKSQADQNLNKDLDAAPNLVSAFTALGPQADDIAAALPNTSDLPGLLVILENMSNDSGVQVKTVQPNTAAATVATASEAGPAPATGSSSSATGEIQTPAPQTYDFSLDLVGRFDAMLKMLDHIQKSSRPMRITGMQFSGTGSSMGGHLTIETYYQDKATLPLGTETIK